MNIKWATFFHTPSNTRSMLIFFAFILSLVVMAIILGSFIRLIKNHHNNKKVK